MWNMEGNRLTEDLIREHVKDLHRQAQQNRLAREAAGGSHSAPRFYAPLLARLGSWMTAWGLRLQARYGKIVEVPRPAYEVATLPPKYC